MGVRSSSSSSSSRSSTSSSSSSSSSTSWEAVAKHLFRQMLEAAAYLHERGVIHKDARACFE
eukprot:15127670-Heterocapsa_arctica.AAC.1